MKNCLYFMLLLLVPGVGVAQTAEEKDWPLQPKPTGVTPVGPTCAPRWR